MQHNMFVGVQKEEHETVTNCHQLILKDQDGKYRLTDVVDIEGMFRIIESIPSKNVELIKQQLAKIGADTTKVTRDKLEKSQKNQ